MPPLSRRDFLKLAALVPPTLFLSEKITELNAGRVAASDSRPNIILIVFDTMTARDLSLYGYPRKTTPNLERLAARANVYHNHTAGGNFTIPGTSSLLTGMLPWTHRAINHAGLIKRDLVDRNLFNLLKDRYNTYAFAQNIWANFILTQFYANLDVYLPPDSFSTVSGDQGQNFPHDINLAYRAFDDYLLHRYESPASVLFGTLAQARYQRSLSNLRAKEYPEGLPEIIDYLVAFKLEDVYTGLIGLSARLKPPYLAYFHLWSPHEPYRPNIRFFRSMNDNWEPPEKPLSRFHGGLSNANINTYRKRYDEYVANVDDEFGRLLDQLEKSGALENSTLVVTSDHGEMLERGIRGHSTPVLYDPIIHIPLLVATPGQRERRDILSPTSATDVLPTLLQLSGKDIPAWCEGRPLPGLGGDEQPGRNIFSVEAKQSSSFGILNKASVAMRKGDDKLTYYTGYDNEEWYELYDLAQDPEEMNDLSGAKKDLADALKAELLESFNRANQPYRK